MDAGPEVDRHFGDVNPDRGGDGRNEAVHLAVELDVLDHVAAEGLQGAAVVAEADLGDAGNQPVGRQRGQAAGEEMLLPAVFAPAADEIVAFPYLFQQQADVVGVVFQIGVDGHDDFPAGVVKARREGGRLAEILAETDDLDPGVGPAGLLEGGERSVPAPVVDEDDFVGDVQAVDGDGDLLDHPGDVFFLVEGRDDDREADFGHIHPRQYIIGGAGSTIRQRGRVYNSLIPVDGLLISRRLAN